MNAKDTRRAWRVMSACALLLAAASILFSAFLFTRVQDERTRSLVRACVRDSTQNQGTLDFLAALDVREETLERARRFYPVLSVRQCEERARKAVGPPPRHKK